MHKQNAVRTQTVDRAGQMPVQTIQFQRTPAAPAISEDIAALVAAAEESIYRIFQKGHPCYIGYSGGKDSSVVTDLVLRVARRVKADGGHPLVVVGTSNTLMENPEIVEHYTAEHAKMRAYARKHQLSLYTTIIKPTLASTWQVKVLSGRGLPSFPGASHDCTSDLKVAPQKRFRNKLFAQWKEQGLPEPVTFLGVRRDESTGRAARMQERGDNAHDPVRSKQGDLVLSPIADWSELDVFEHLGNVTNGLLESYSDFREVDRIYAHSAGSSCSVVAMDAYGARQSKGCGARHGCHACQIAEDKSLEAMIEFDPRYAYAKGLNLLNKYIRAQRYNWSTRHWIGRTIQGGFVEIKPDTYSASFVRELTRYMLQLDYDEARRAQRAGEAPKFELLPLEMMIAVDAMQNINGLARPYQIWADYRDIHKRGIRYDIPEIEAFPPTPMPETRYLYVGNDWDDGSYSSRITGLRDEYVEALTADSPCAPQLKDLKSGQQVWDVPRDLEFKVDLEAALNIEDYEVERLLEEYDRGYVPGGIAAGYKFYARYGALKLAHNQLGKHDEVLRRTAFKDRLGLTLDFKPEDLLSKSISFDELPADVQRMWKDVEKGEKGKARSKSRGEPEVRESGPAQAAGRGRDDEQPDQPHGTASASPATPEAQQAAPELPQPRVAQAPALAIDRIWLGWMDEVEDGFEEEFEAVMACSM